MRHIIILDVKQELVLSFAYAFRGIFDGIKNERNMMIHYSVVVLVVAFWCYIKVDSDRMGHLPYIMWNGHCT